MLTTWYAARAQRHTHNRNLKAKSDKLTIVFIYTSSKYIQTCSKLHFGVDKFLHTSGRGMVFSDIKEWLYLKTGSAPLMTRKRYLAHRMTSPIAALCAFSAVTTGC